MFRENSRFIMQLKQKFRGYTPDPIIRIIFKLVNITSLCYIFFSVKFSAKLTNALTICWAVRGALVTMVAWPNTDMVGQKT